MFRYLGFDNPGDLRRPSASPSFCSAVPGQQQWPPCWGVFPVPFSSRHGSPLPAFPRQKQASGSCARARVPTESATSRLIGGGFIVGGPYQLSAQTQGGIHEKELWIHIEYQFLPSADTLPPPALILALPPSFTSSQNLWRPSASSHPQSHSFSSFFIHLCILPFYPPSLLPPSAQCNYSNGFFPLG